MISRNRERSTWKERIVSNTAFRVPASAGFLARPIDSTGIASGTFSCSNVIWSDLDSHEQTPTLNHGDQLDIHSIWRHRNPFYLAAAFYCWRYSTLSCS